MYLYGLVGFPLGHSFSQKYFTEKFEKEKIKAFYRNFELENIAALNDIILQNPELQGFNVTIPHKQTILPYIDELNGAAREIGAVNCVKIVREDNCIRLTGYNTDTEGFRLSLSDFIPPTVTRALILGNGGAAQAVRYTLKKLGISSLTVSRNPQGENEIGYADVHRYLPTHFLIVNTTPLGTWPDTVTCPSIPYEQLTPAHYLFDLVYNPDITLFMQQGLQAGAHVRNGLGMLIGQAEAAWKIWNNR